MKPNSRSAGSKYQAGGLTQHSLAEDLLADVVCQQELLHLVSDEGGVELLGEGGHLVQVGSEVGEGREQGRPGAQAGEEVRGEAGRGGEEGGKAGLCHGTKWINREAAGQAGWGGGQSALWRH